MMNGCNNKETKLIIENNNTSKETKETEEKNKPFVNKNSIKKKILKN